MERSRRQALNRRARRHGYKAGWRGPLAAVLHRPVQRTPDMTLGGATGLETIKGLSSQPMLLLVAALNVLMIGALIYVAKAQQEERATLMRGLIDNCGSHKQ